MKIQYLNGGLANQAFQYIFVRFAELYNPQDDPWLIDDSFFFVHQAHNGYELEKVFGIKANLLSRQFDSDVWEEFIRNRQDGGSVAQTFQNMGIAVHMVAETANYTEHNPFNGPVHRIPSNEFHPEITRLPWEHIYYHGYWIHTEWFRSYQDALRLEFSFPPITESHNLQYAAHIANAFSIGVHIRRGDYVTIGWALENDYYRQSMASLASQYPDAVFFIFSDEPEWCRSHAGELGFDLPGRIVFVEGNTKGQNFRDLQLMCKCKGLLMSNSAFCFLAALLNRKLEFCVQPPTGN